MCAVHVYIFETRHQYPSFSISARRHGRWSFLCKKGSRRFGVQKEQADLRRRDRSMSDLRCRDGSMFQSLKHNGTFKLMIPGGCGRKPGGIRWQDSIATMPPWSWQEGETTAQLLPWSARRSHEFPRELWWEPHPGKSPRWLFVSRSWDRPCSEVSMREDDDRQCDVCFPTCDLSQGLNSLHQFPEALDQFPEALDQFPEALYQFPKALYQFPEALHQFPEALFHLRYHCCLRHFPTFWNLLP